MKLPRRNFCIWQRALPLCRPCRGSQTRKPTPARYVRLIVPFAPGGGFDAAALPLANRLSEVWGQQLVIENKGGAGGTIGTRAAADAAPDGYTLLMTGNNFAYGPLFLSLSRIRSGQRFRSRYFVCTFP